MPLIILRNTEITTLHRHQASQLQIKTKKEERMDGKEHIHRSFFLFCSFKKCNKKKFKFFLFKKVGLKDKTQHSEPELAVPAPCRAVPAHAAKAQSLPVSPYVTTGWKSSTLQTYRCWSYSRVPQRAAPLHSTAGQQGEASEMAATSTPHP